jgi:hypothetical protein
MNKAKTLTPTERSLEVRPNGGMRMDAESVRARHDRRKAWFLAEASRQAVNRALMAKCESYYDGVQYTYEDAEILRQRGQNPVVYNEIKPTIDWLIGTERRARVDFVVIAEEEGDEASEDARLKTKLLKYLDDTNRSSFERSYAAEDAFKAGLGWLEVGLRGDKNGPPIYVGAESWRNILHDSLASKRDLSDARYLFRIKVVDLDIALAIFPDKEEELRSCVQTGDDVAVFREWLGGSGLITGLDAFGLAKDDELDYLTPKPVDLFNARERVLLLECWSREPVRNTEANAHGISDPVTMKMFCSVMTEKDTMIEAASPFKHDKFSFIPLWAYRNRRTGLPYGPIMQLMGPQEALNHRMSRALYEASSNQIKIEEGAVDPDVMDMDEIRAELNDPNGMAVFAKGALSGQKVQERANIQEARAHLELAQHDIQTIRQSSGVNGDSRGLDTNSISGKAVLAKQDQGSLLTAELFDNLLFARQMEGEMVLSLSEQFITEKMTVHNQGDKGGYEHSTMNDWDAENGMWINDITKRRARFVVGEQAWKQAFAESAFESLMLVLTQLASAAPQVVVAMLDVVFEMHPNLPKKALILERIRSVNGQSSADGKMTPEQEQAKQQQAQQAKAQFDLQMAQMQAQVKEAQARGEKLDAEAMAKRLESLHMAAQGAQLLAMAPQAAPIADELLRSAGFKDAGAQAGVIDPAAMPAMPEQQAMPPMVMQQPIPDPLQADGAMQGIETPDADGMQPFPNNSQE